MTALEVGSPLRCAAIRRVRDNCGAKPKQVVVDAGFTTRRNIAQMVAEGVDLIGSFRELDTGRHLQRRRVRPQFHPGVLEYDASWDIIVAGWERS